MQLAALNGSAAMLVKFNKAGGRPNAPLTDYVDTALYDGLTYRQNRRVTVLLEGGVRSTPRVLGRHDRVDVGQRPSASSRRHVPSTTARTQRPLAFRTAATAAVSKPHAGRAEIGRGAEEFASGALRH